MPFGAVACTECWTADGQVPRPFESARCALEFNDASARLILAYKDGGERALAPILARLLVEALDSELLESSDCLAYVPASSEALRRRGFDHMERIASEVSALTGLPCLDLLVANSRLDQRELSREQRAENMAEAFELLEGVDEPPRRVLLIDDVLTTGATLTAATETLLGGGVERVDVGAICRVW
ncbi:MAG: ComF family protein [bacterium]|nr:ComF family protein [bacterium]